ncbi:hypothetical protein [Komagataeibacter europaeus]|nr:hypothetical protein [Komagataeibacter europaeus]
MALEHVDKKQQKFLGVALSEKGGVSGSFLKKHHQKLPDNWPDIPRTGFSGRLLSFAGVTRPDRVPYIT